MKTEKMYLFFKKLFNILFILFVIEGIILSRELHLNFSYLVQIVILFVVSVIYMMFAYMRKHSHTRLKDIFLYIVKFSSIEWVLLLFLAYNLIWILIYPQRFGISISNSIAEAGMIVMLFLFFPMKRLIDMKELNVKGYIKTALITVVVLNVVTDIVWIIESINPGFYTDGLNFLDNLPIDIFSINEVVEGWGIVRIVQSNLVWIPVLIFFILASAKKNKWYNYLFLFLSTFAVLTSYLKSLWLGVAAGVFVILIYHVLFNKEKKQKKCFWQMFIFMIAAVVILDTAAFGGTIKNRVINAFHVTSTQSSEGETKETEDEDTKDTKDTGETDMDEEEENKQKDKEGSQESILIRVEQIQLLVNKWKEEPIFGFGYGAYIDGYTRDYRIPNYYLFETTFFALLMKLGVFGLCIWLGTIIFVIIQAFRKMKPEAFVMWLAVFGCFGVTIQTNPLLFNTNSVFLLLALLLSIYGLHKEEKADENRSINNNI